MVAVLIEHVSRNFTMLSDDTCSCHPILLDIIEELEWQQSLPLVGRDVVTRAGTFGHSFLFALDMLGCIEDEVGVHSEDLSDLGTFPVDGKCDVAARCNG